MPLDASNLPPPTYVQDEDNASDSSVLSEPQILIIPATDSLRFQQGFLGAEGERAAIEGELQIKGTQDGRWRKVTMDLRTVESALDHSIELAHSNLVLYEADGALDTPLPSSFPFALPLTSDTPQCIHTPQSSLAHILTAKLYPADDSLPLLTKAQIVHTRRFITYAHSLAIAPVKKVLESPARIEVEVPRTTFTSTEPVPIYVTVPSPPRELVIEHGLRLRNIKAELMRTVHVKHGALEEDVEAVDVDVPDDTDDDTDDEDVRGEGAPLGVSVPAHPHFHPHPVALDKVAEASSSSSAYPNYHLNHGSGASYKTVISRSGALCRFHTSLPVRLRFILHQSSPSSSPSDSTRPLPAGEFGLMGGDTECASISQSTLLHSVTFRLRIHATFRNMSNHTERVCTIAIPITFLPPPAHLPEVEEWVDSAYHKKHDRPPSKTVRGEDTDAAPHYEEGQAGPSGAPPPFEERDAPPPFFSEASTSTRLPTFLESEQEIFVPHNEDTVMAPAAAPLPRYLIEGEGVLFGFPPSAQFSGHSDELERGGTSTPPPTLEMATRDPNVTGLARLEMEVPERAMQALGLALQQHEEAATGEAPPPPPPPMDDPSDPPPSIHSEYRSREGVAHQMLGAAPPSTPPPPQVHTVDAAHPAPHPNAPPPYLVPEAGGDHEHVARPPPYVDVMPSAHEG
ncbi:hypothetical protein BV25DRAFT_1793336 [Artomyces pyxidatus]|uniref:Uncharacterized protein n=1 Tax=Artomyces pyxidatus TaxID=48021 RepID=A0ACB8TIM2_9AGAM|nr:hypothetical protein BV25DRAFT_1793336 [Artomyces pyxidatus]